jgi:DNA-binding HxlR family transcriptional regulator
VNTSNLPANLARLTTLVHHRWNIPVIAEIHRHSGAKFVTLLNRLEVSRGSLSASLSHLSTLDLVRKNEGHGHPMRPEYLLTRQGLAIGDEAVELVDALRRTGELDLALRKWSMPLVVAIGSGRTRFNELRAALCDATPRAITIGLRSLLQHGWVNRRLIDEFPPTAGYELRAKGRRILTRLDNLNGAS